MGGGAVFQYHHSCCEWPTGSFRYMSLRLMIIRCFQQVADGEECYHCIITRFSIDTVFRLAHASGGDGERGCSSSSSISRLQLSMPSRVLPRIMPVAEGAWSRFAVDSADRQDVSLLSPRRFLDPQGI